jgi:hypothetical protein
MKGVVMKILLGIIMLVTSAFTHAENLITVEWAPFIKADGVTDQQLIEAANQVNVDFLAKQPGFIKRELIKKNGTEYADVIHWDSNIDAVSAGNKVLNCVECAQYFQLMNMEASVKAGAGFSHYEILKKW